MITIATESGSVYEIDYEEKRIRRLSGTSPPHAMFGADLMWRTFEGLDFPTVGERLAILFDSSKGYRGTLVTSRVVHIKGQNAA